MEITAVSCSAFSNRVIPRKPQMKTIMFNDVDDDDNDNNKDGNGDEPWLAEQSKKNPGAMAGPTQEG